MNAVEQMILSLVEEQGAAYLVSQERKSHPELSGQALVDATVGDAKHAVRMKLGVFGFVVDVAWPTVAPTLESAVAAEIALESYGATN